MEEENKLTPLTITFQIVKNLGNFETVRFGIEYELNGTPPAEAFRQAEIEVENAYNELKKTFKTCKNSENVNGENLENSNKIKRDLELDSTEFKKLQIALKQGLVNMNEISEHYNLTKDIVEKLLNY
jgi:predicted DNA-binding transcriptional regulator